MKRFPYAHASHAQWRVAVERVLAQLRLQLDRPDSARAVSLALLYITDHYAEQAQDILEQLSAGLPEVSDWVGTVGVGIAANNIEYFDQPALALMLCDLSPHQYRVFSGVAPLALSPRLTGADGFVAHTALVHADGSTPELAELIAELAQRTASACVFGGLSSSRSAQLQFAHSSAGTLRGQGAASGVFQGGLSGVAFDATAGLLVRVTQGAQPVGRAHRVTAAQGHLVLTLDQRPALDLLFEHLGIAPVRLAQSIERLRSTLVGLTPPDVPGQALARSAGLAPAVAHSFGPDVLVRHIVGLDVMRHALVFAEPVAPGSQLAFCQRHVQAAAADLMRICTEVRAELEAQTPSLPPGGALVRGGAPAFVAPQSQRIAGAIYVSCAGRGGPHFGAASAELRLVRRALGDVPLVGFFAGGEIAHQRLLGYSAVLMVFALPLA
ncbi:FIST N-terminal domain-containing protein [Hydrogenophaga sp.]|uniref:FIST signal transduction protein n=1 Tax=Hydrogenophaga sp. TaxID=1904254 RepID=UPI0019BB7723|nr:FIST N-terminal domain-containing protein [Hydrogenophaga sp.]MBD3893186.1 hypothetical protein [Hydrogenophaga sp.]